MNSNSASAATTKPAGRHPNNRLTALAVRTLKTPGRYADGNGLYLTVDPSGARRWIWRGVVQGKRCELGLGGALVVSLATAREQARVFKEQARAGENPRTVRRRARLQAQTKPTFKELAETVHREHSKAFKNAKHRAQWIASLTADVFPRIGDRPIDTITAADVLDVLTPIWLAKPETARRVKQRMKVVFETAKAKQYRVDNPTDAIAKVLPKHKTKKQHHAALPYTEVPGFVTALRSAPDTIRSVRLAFEFLILTATRTSEVQQATWDEIDLARQVWTIPAHRMKAGVEHRVPLCARAVEILEEAQTFASPWVFPGHKAGQPQSNNTFAHAARRLTDADMTPHGFRSSFRDWAAEQTSFAREVCEAALAHTVRDQVEAAYFRTDLFARRRDLMQAWATFVATPAITAVAVA